MNLLSSKLHTRLLVKPLLDNRDHFSSRLITRWKDLRTESERKAGLPIDDPTLRRAEGLAHILDEQSPIEGQHSC